MVVGVDVATPGGAVVAPSVVAAAGCNPPGATPTGGCNMGAGKGGTPEVGGTMAVGGLIPGIMATSNGRLNIHMPHTVEPLLTNPPNYGHNRKKSP